MGFGVESGSDSETLAMLQTTLDASFNVTPLALIPLAVVFFMAFRKVTPLPTILFGALLGGFTAIV